MAELDKEIIGSWFEIKSTVENITHLRDHFKLPDTEIKNTIAKLHSSIEEGIIEYKKQAFEEAFSLIKSLNFDASAIPLLKEVANNINCLTYVILIQRLISKKAIKPKISHTEEDDLHSEAEKHYSVTEVSEIIKDVQDAITVYPELKTNKHIVTIQHQVQKYKKELESIKKIIPNLPPDKKENFSINSRNTINDILLKLITHYKTFMEEMQKDSKKQITTLESYDFLPTVELFKKQAEISDRIKTTFVFADRERFKILDTVRTLKNFEAILKESLKKESDYYHNVSLSEAGKREISRQFCLETIKVLERQAEANF